MSYSAEVLADAPAAWYRCDEASGLLLDSSGNGNNTTVAGGTATYHIAGAVPSEPSNFGIYLTGSPNYFSAPDHATLDLGDVFTLECWVKRDTISVQQMLFSKNTNAYSLFFEVDNTVLVIKSGVAVVLTSSITIVNDNIWHYIAATKNGAAGKLYIDAIDRTGAFTNATFADNASVLELGREAGSFYYNGSIDEIAVYPTALSQSRVLAHYNAAIFTTPSVAWIRA